MCISMRFPSAQPSDSDPHILTLTLPAATRIAKDYRKAALIIGTTGRICHFRVLEVTSAGRSGSESARKYV